MASAHTMNPSVQPVQYNDDFSEKWITYLSPPEWRDRVEVEFQEQPISSLEPAGCLVDPDVVNGWVDRIRCGFPIPPPVAVVTERGTHYLHDGNHRYLALSEYLGSDAAVRVAIARPLPGYRFRRRSCEGYSTYKLERDPHSVRTLLRWALIPMLCVLAVLLTRGVPGTSHSPFFVFLVVSVLISTRLAGWAGGVVASLLNCTGAAYLLLPPIGSVAISDRVHLAQFVLTAFTMIILALGLGLQGRSRVRLFRLRQRH